MSGGIVPITRCGAKLYLLVNTNILNNTETPLPFDTDDEEDFDTDAFHDPSSNAERLTVPAGLGGLYLVTAQWNFVTDPTPVGYRQGFLYHKTSAGATVHLSSDARYPGTSALNPSSDLCMLVEAAAGDYFYLALQHNEGITLAARGSKACNLACIRLAD